MTPEQLPDPDETTGEVGELIASVTFTIDVQGQPGEIRIIRPFAQDGSTTVLFRPAEPEEEYPDANKPTGN